MCTRKLDCHNDKMDARGVPVNPARVPEMIRSAVTASMCLLLSLAACTPHPQSTWLSPSERAYLNMQRPFPNFDDVCVLLGESDNTATLRSDGQELIACPKHETGASDDRRRNGARLVGQSDYWLIFSLPSDLAKQQMQTF